MNDCIKALDTVLLKKYISTINKTFKVQFKTQKPRDSVPDPVLARRQAAL